MSSAGRYISMGNAQDPRVMITLQVDRDYMKCIEYDAQSNNISPGALIDRLFLEMMGYRYPDAKK